MKTLRFEYIQENTVNVIVAKVSQNAKIGVGYIVQTYHFDIEQIKNSDITLDKSNCLNCPLSYNMNNGKSGGCYTHKGMQLMGLKSMLRSLNKRIDSIKEFNKNEFLKFVESVKNTYKVDLVRFGAYGEPILLGEFVTSHLATLSEKTTGYTHQYAEIKNIWANRYFMASVHRIKDIYLAKKYNYRSFIAKKKEETFFGVNCPASKESEKNLSCIACGLCNGMKTGIKKDVYINVH